MSGGLKALLIALALALAASAGVVGLRSVRSSDNKPPSHAAAVAPTATSGAWQNVLVADHATGGVLTIVIPPGAADEMDAGNPSAVELPPVMRLKVGDQIVIRNDDDRPHLVMYAYVLPGETNERVLDKTGIEVYSAGCSVTAQSTGTFMSMMVGS
jgi:hypothetical protein